MNLETAVKLISLYGDSKNDDLNSYVDTVTFVLKNCEASEQKQYLEIAKIRLRGEVAAAVRRNELDTWTELKKFLRERGDKQQKKLGHKLIIALARSGVETKAAEVSTEHKSFTKGVNEPIRGILLNRKTTSFNDAVKDALSLELELEEDRDLDRRRRPQNSMTGDTKCFNCNKVGHKAANCRSRPISQVKAMTSQNTCFNCGKLGHFARDCRAPKQQYTPRFANTHQNTYQRREQQTSVPNRRNEQQGNGTSLPMDSRPGRNSFAQVGRVQGERKGVLELEIQESETGTCKMLIDSGSDVTILKLASLHDDVWIRDSREDKLILNGIGTTITTIGQADCHIKIGNQEIIHPVHIVPKSFQLDEDGLLGYDILKRLGVKIDYNTMQMEVDNQMINMSNVKVSQSECNRHCTIER
ncbi:hypothetical protein J6590_014671 [Homalodisca vitripennis]|nr:hypothetical protein J6590_014671 [Homalodisca vitripennis]